MLSSANAGTVIITGTNSSMPVTINGGTLQMGNGAAQDGTFGGYNGPTYTDQSMLVINNVNSEDYTNTAITGSGSVTKMGPGTLVLGNKSFTGSMNVNGGTLALNGTFGAQTIYVNNGGTLLANQTNAFGLGTLRRSSSTPADA